MPKVSAGIILFRNLNTDPEFFIVHPGGPFWKNKDEGAWTISKGLIEEGEDMKQAAVREMQEEVGIEIRDLDKLIYLGEVKLKSGKTVHGFGYEYTDPNPIEVKSNTTQTEWPPKSGKFITIPEVEKGEWFDAETAKKKLNSAQSEFVNRVLGTKE